jgi:alpha-L-fucosidase
MNSYFFTPLVAAKTWAAIFALSRLALLSTPAADIPTLTPALPEAIQRWQDKRFAMFIHWGPVSLTGEEIGWSRGAQTPIEQYDSLYKQFNPTNFNAAEWVGVARAAGMKYLVLTTKHHDGFCLWNTKYTDFSIMHSPFARDIVGELSAECKKQGIAFGTYYSTCDWHHPDFPLGSPGGTTRKPNPNMERYTQYLRGQVTELIRNYGPLIELWFDVPQETGPERGIPTANLVRSLQSDILINDRAGGTPGDFNTPEQQIGGFDMQRPWETCMTICTQWSWKPQDEMKSLPQCLQTLIRTAGGNGNLLFNVGPMPDGRIEPRQVERLREMGTWLQKYGESIYSTRGGPWKPTKTLASTRRGNTIYVHLLQRDGERVTLPNIPRKLISSSLLTGGTLEVKQTSEQISISVSAAARQPIDTIVKFELDGSAMDLAPVGVETQVKATASGVFQKDDSYNAGMAFDGDRATRWATDGGTRKAWLESDLGKPTTFSRVMIDEWAPGGKRVQTFELQYQQAGGAWKTFHSGTTLGPGWEKKFDPITAQRVRLQILEANEGPTINEFELYQN